MGYISWIVETTATLDYEESCFSQLTYTTWLKVEFSTVPTAKVTRTLPYLTHLWVRTRAVLSRTDLVCFSNAKLTSF